MCVVGLQAGENTLNTLCALRVARVLSSGQFRSVAEADARAAVLSDYVKFMTTPGTHDDTYAESFHRSFFCDWQELKPTSSREVKSSLCVHRKVSWNVPWCPILISLQVLEFAERRSERMLKAPVPDSQLNVIGCLPMAVPFVLLSANEEEAVSAINHIGWCVNCDHFLQMLRAMLCSCECVCWGIGCGGVCESHSSSSRAEEVCVSVRPCAVRHTERSVCETAGWDGPEIARAERMAHVSTLHTESWEVQKHQDSFHLYT